MDQHSQCMADQMASHAGLVGSSDVTDQQWNDTCKIVCPNGESCKHGIGQAGPTREGGVRDLDANGWRGYPPTVGGRSPV